MKILGDGAQPMWFGTTQDQRYPFFITGVLIILSLNNFTIFFEAHSLWRYTRLLCSHRIFWSDRNVTEDIQRVGKALAFTFHLFWTCVITAVSHNLVRIDNGSLLNHSFLLQYQHFQTTSLNFVRDCHFTLTFDLSYFQLNRLQSYYSYY